MDLYLIRHTTPNIEKGICYGQTDLDLVENYLEEFKLVHESLTINDEFQVYSSPLKRCMMLANSFGKTVITDERLKELNFGSWEMTLWDKIPEHELTPWMNDFVNIKVPSGESYLDLAERVQQFFNQIHKTHHDATCIIITHAGPMRALLANLLNLSLEDSFKIKIDYGAVFKISKTTAGYRITPEINLQEPS
ncbi:alpha-ribazole phosphatase [Cognatitamlana onchidii]|uniref:alpha-ribazole phosphatase n=1 Tax=Cognatitamlana onchidii TaxID=2562860 RepID=UPI0010A5BE18|nr:alpha-ribazole phosphatase [Algibacter onchidii]